MEKVYVGVGSNLADPLQQVVEVMPQLRAIHRSRLTRRSSLYRTEPVGNTNQDDFINAMVELQTELEPVDLLLELQAIEHACYRQRDNEDKWGPRTMDLDIILFGNRRQHDSHLILPHAEMQHRRFVLMPLLEIAGDVYIPGLGSLSWLLEHAPKMRVERLPDPPDLDSI
jgi:2-amino-4-hydroxy-6-hydroxymethyldihydropteridine diphosphokinase